MILNVWTVSALFLCGVRAVLALVALGVAAQALPALRRRSEAGVLEVLEQRMHLLSLVLATLALVGLLAWPLFYLLLASYVSDLAPFGVMCAFGVTNVRPGLVSTLELAQPISLLALGFWYLLARIDRKTATAPLLGSRYVLALPVAALALTESAVEVVYLLVEKAGRPVTCCTQFLDTEASRLAGALPTGAALAIRSPGIALAAYFVLHAAVVVAALRARHRPRRSIAFLVVALAAANIWLTYQVWLGTLAPRVLELPHHHCVYELFTGTLALGPAALLAVGGTGALCWPVLLELLRARAPEGVAAMQRAVWALGAVAIASEALIVAVHL